MVCCRKVGERVGREKERREKMRWSVSTITSSNSNLGTKIIIITLPKNIWLILARSSPPLEIRRWFPQIVFILLNRVRPINVGFSNRFFCSSDKRFLIIIIKKKFEEDKS